MPDVGVSSLPLGSAKIRNIVQTAQEREIIKTAPDMVVYIDSLPFINNPYLSQGATNLVAVNFNDYVTAVSTSYSIDSLIPTGSVNLSVPNGSKHLFMAPGGNIIIDIMSSIRIYAKSYFFSPSGNTIFRRIFNGIITSVALNELPTSLEITISIAGICRLLEISQIELSRSLISNSSVPLTFYRTNQSSNLTIYGALYDTLRRDIDFSEFFHTSFQEQFIANSKDAAAIKTEYVTAWAYKLQDLCRDVRLFGLSSNNKAITSAITTGNQNQTDGTQAKAGPPPTSIQSQTEMSRENQAIIGLIGQYAFGQVIGDFKLFGSQLTSRVERLRQLIDLMGFEGYQDVDGLIIIKPPLYNLDCTILGSSTAGGLITPETNPFIISMSEILSENYLEDEAAIHRTSMAITPNFGDPAAYQMEGQADKSVTVRYIDINLVKKYGIREEPPKPMGMLKGDVRGNYAFCVAELAKGNRGFSTYSVSIPLRPELRLGFTVYMPHKDMYAYITGIAMGFNVGGQATTSLTCNFVRKRPLFLQQQTITSEVNGTPSSVNASVFASQENLVHAFTVASTAQTDQFGNNILSESGTISSLPLVPSACPNSDQQAIRTLLANKLGAIFETTPDQGVAANNATWRIQSDYGGGQSPSFSNRLTQPDDTGTWYNGGWNDTSGSFNAAKVADGEYLARTTMVQPYTNEKGYEVISPLPWGRYATLNQALVDFTENFWPEDTAMVASSVAAYGNPVVSAFLAAGLTTPPSSNSASSQLIGSDPSITSSNLPNGDTLIASTFEFQKWDKTNVSSFELNYTRSDKGVTETSFAVPDWSNPNTSASGVVSGSAGAISTISQSSSTSGLQAWSDSVDALQVFLQGFIGPPNSNNVGPYAVSTLPQNTDIGGYAPSSGPLSGVLLSMGATFTRSPYGAILGLRPTGATENPAYTTGTNATYIEDTLGKTLINIGSIVSGGG